MSFYNPSKIKPYLGKTFVTLNPYSMSGNEHRYSIDNEGMLRGKESLDGAKVELVAGMPSELRFDVRGEINEKQTWDAFIRKNGRNPPKKGLSLVVSLTEEDSKKYGGPGLFSSPIQRILPYPEEKTISARSENYQVTVGPNNNAHIEKYNHSGLFACIYDRIKRALMPQSIRFKALPGQSILENMNDIEVRIRENINRIEVRDKRTGISNWAIGFLK